MKMIKKQSFERFESSGNGKKLIEAKTVTSTQNKKSEILIEHNTL